MSTDTAPLSEDDASRIARTCEAIAQEVATVVEGKRGIIDLALTVILAGGHLLLEDVPGVGKTVLAKSLASAMGASRARIQFTPDLLPGDVTGASVYDQSTGHFEFRTGAVFTNVLLADEINRASPKTQSALLEAMEERQVSADGATYPLPDPFLVIATANPIEIGGTYALPEAQRDRFLAQTSLGYPVADAEARMLAAQTGPVAPSGQHEPSAQHDPTAQIRARTDPAQMAAMISAVRHVHAAPEVLQYAVRLAHATREHPEAMIGVSPRAVVHLIRAAKARAAQTGRTWIEPQHLQELLQPVWAHRLHLTPAAHARGASGAAILRDIVATIPVRAGAR